MSVLGVESSGTLMVLIVNLLTWIVCMRLRWEHAWCGFTLVLPSEPPHPTMSLKTLGLRCLHTLLGAQAPRGSSSALHTALCCGEGTPGRLTGARPRVGWGLCLGQTELFPGSIFEGAQLINTDAEGSRQLVCVRGQIHRTRVEGWWRNQWVHWWVDGWLSGRVDGWQKLEERFNGWMEINRC